MTLEQLVSEVCARRSVKRLQEVLGGPEVPLNDELLAYAEQELKTAINQRRQS
jgi:hypothetical protein